QEWTDSAGVVHAAIDRQITNVADGTEATDAVNKAQLDAIASRVEEVAPYFAAAGAGDGSDVAIASGDNAIAAGAYSVASGAQSGAFGMQSSAMGDYATALG